MKKIIKIVIIIIVFFIIGIVLFTYNQHNNIQVYKKVDKIKILEVEYKINKKYEWIEIIDQNQLNQINEKYQLSVSNIDFEKHYLIISFGKDITEIYYNVRDKHFNDRGKYIGLIDFNQNYEDKIFIYQIEKIPLMNSDVAGVSPDFVDSELLKAKNNGIK